MSLKWFAIESDQAQILLRHGHLMSSGERWVAQQVDANQVGFSQMDVERPSGLFCWFKAIRAISLTATLMPALATLLWLSLLGLPINLWIASGAVFAVVLLQMSVNLFNDVEDYFKLIDLPGTLGGSGVIQQGWLSAQQVARGAWVCLVLGCLAGLPALLNAPVVVLLCGAAAVVGVLGYSGWPLRLKYRALGDAAVLLLCGPALTFGIAAAATGADLSTLPVGVLALGLFFGFAATAILNANNINDLYVDGARGSVTLAAKLGFVFARHWQTLYYLLAGFALVTLQQYEQAAIWMLLPFLATPLVLMQLRALYLADRPDHQDLAQVRFQAAQTHLLLGVLLCIGMLLSHL